MVESYGTERGPRQRVVAWLGELDKAGRLGVESAAEGGVGIQRGLHEDVTPEWVEVNIKGVRAEKIRDFGGLWLGLELMRRLDIMDRGMASEANFDFLNREGRRYILGAHRGQLKEYESELLKADWRVVHSGLWGETG